MVVPTLLCFGAGILLFLAAVLVNFRDLARARVVPVSPDGAVVQSPVPTPWRGVWNSLKMLALLGIGCCFTFVITCILLCIGIYQLENRQVRIEQEQFNLLTSGNAEDKVMSIRIIYSKKTIKLADRESIHCFCLSFQKAVYEGYVPKAIGLAWRLIVDFKDDTSVEYPLFTAYSKEGHIRGFSVGRHAEMFDDSIYYGLTLEEPIPVAMSEALTIVEEENKKPPIK